MSTTPVWEKFFATKSAPVSEIKKIYPYVPVDSSNCECIVQIGVFFDGTGNNESLDSPSYSDSNIARLSKKYNKEKNFSSVYVPGLGTPFPLIGELKKTTDGSGFGVGGEGRILMAMFKIINIISLAVTGRDFCTDGEIAALCSEKVSSNSKREVLSKYGLPTSLPNMDFSEKVKFIKKLTTILQNSVKDIKSPVIKEIFIDIFGFSRGAAEARVFCHWLAATMENFKLIDIPLRFRFLGLFDTVASVGKWNLGVNAIVGDTDGHSNWARTDHLHILPQVENCVHFIAMHEQRKNFPLDTVAIGETTLPSNCHEYVYPGTHSDVGGGYIPGELGISYGDSPAFADRKKLSQIPLNHMYECAVAAGVPFIELSKETSDNNSQRFAICPQLKEDYEKFFELNGPRPRRLSEWLLPYLVWRWKKRHTYANIDHVKNASDSDRKNLVDGNNEFTSVGRRMQLMGDPVASEKYEKAAREDMNFNANSNYGEYRQSELSYLAPEAVALQKRVSVDLKNMQIPEEVEHFFEFYVHDSVAGFRKDWVESTGHWKYRRLFRGYAQPRLSSLGNNEIVGEKA